MERDPSPSAVHYEWKWGATVTMVTKSGARFVSTVDAPKGSAPRGIEWSDIDAKFHALMPQSGLPPGRIEQALKLIHEFERVDRAVAIDRPADLITQLFNYGDRKYRSCCKHWRFLRARRRRRRQSGWV